MSTSNYQPTTAQINAQAKIPLFHLITELDIGGAQKALLRLLTHLDRDRFSPTVICLYNGDKAVAQEIRALSIPVIDLGMTAKWRLDAFWRLYRLLRRERPTILHTWMFHANIPGRVLGRLTGIPIVISSERTMGQESRWRYRLNRLTDPLTDRVVCVSQLVADFVVAEVGIPRHKTIVIPNGIDAQAFEHLPTKQKARVDLGLPLDSTLVGTVARLDPVKRLDVLLQATALMDDVHTVIVGAGPERESLEALSERLGLADRVHFVGQQSNVPEWLAALDIFALTSDWEGMSNAILEAMAAGLPIVATAVGGTPEVVVDGVTGLLVPPRDPDALTQAITRLLRDPDLRRKMGRAGRERVQQHFSVERMVQQTQSLYEQLLAKKGL
ncbi:MAG: glycosyltransferase [Anaerolineae bacterium]|nr:glycosyltransferase [Anaerolineae bacterium]